ncbi:unnamed protein product [marine sediment metagenome]|uniref:Uncharacterized protein n=1 Tax=marine sediment metagenome TaxID=412755 RepID=X0U6S9_9ZZZZ
MATEISQPIFGASTMPFPSEATIEPFWVFGEITTLGGKTRRDVMARKYKYTLRWSLMSVTDYDNLEAVINALVAATFTYEKWPHSTSGVSCLGTLSARRLEYGAGDTNYLSSVTLILTEVSAR